MIIEPKLEHRDEQPYVAIRTQVTMRELGTVLPPLLGQVFAWLERKGMAPAGAPFFRYLVVDMDSQLDMEVGVPVATAASGDGRISTGVLPSDRYGQNKTTLTTLGFRRKIAYFLKCLESKIFS